LHQEIVFTGFGGQGIILAGYICGKAASIYENLYATLTQSYGPESRGGASSAQLIISDKPIYYPHISKIDVLVALSPEGYQQYKNKINGDSKPVIIVEKDFVSLDTADKNSAFVYPIPATKLAEELGKRMVANIVVLGFFTAVTKIISRKSMQQAIKESVPAGSEELNFKAFEKGFFYA
jgi:2-oxoglutarate ferredoxin oxidoreductase subunit gamma